MFTSLRTSIAAAMFLWLALASSSSLAQNLTNVNPQTLDFTFDAAPRDDGLRIDRSTLFCNTAGQADYNCQEQSNPQWYTTGQMGDDTTTAFLQEKVEINGVSYYHLVIGSEEEGFVQEIYMQMGGTNWRTLPGVQRQTSFSGGRACLAGNRASFDERVACNADNNGADPLSNNSILTGNGTGDPGKMVMRQFIRDDTSGFTQEFLKDQLANKPIISQDIATGRINLKFVMDMSNSDYDTDSIAGVMTNQLVINDPDIPENQGNFDFATDQGEGANVSGGRYKFVRSFVSDEFITGLGETNGYVDFPTSTYTYYDGQIDPVMDIDWEAIKDPNQN
ncbi:MAG: hypothetical protein GXP14_05485 [Gammaproteobacteria bacterium]|nr:hypothetical protein [Gammaproteobacteria bacterium]